MFCSVTYKKTSFDNSSSLKVHVCNFVFTCWYFEFTSKITKIKNENIFFVFNFDLSVGQKLAIPALH